MGGEVTSLCLIVNKADGHSQNHTVGNYPELIGSMEVQKVEMIELFNEHKKNSRDASNYGRYAKQFERYVEEDDG
jgi:hypothetical protein